MRPDNSSALGCQWETQSSDVSVCSHLWTFASPQCSITSPLPSDLLSNTILVFPSLDSPFLLTHHIWLWACALGSFNVQKLNSYCILHHFAWRCLFTPIWAYMVVRKLCFGSAHGWWLCISNLDLQLLSTLTCRSAFELINVKRGTARAETFERLVLKTNIYSLCLLNLANIGTKTQWNSSQSKTGSFHRSKREQRMKKIQ